MTNADYVLMPNWARGTALEWAISKAGADREALFWLLMGVIVVKVGSKEERLVEFFWLRRGGATMRCITNADVSATRW